MLSFAQNATINGAENELPSFTRRSSKNGRFNMLIVVMRPGGASPPQERKPYYMYASPEQGPLIRETISPKENKAFSSPKKIWVRQGREEDGAAMASIYRPYVENTSVTFEYEPPSPEEFVRRMEERRGRLPWLVCGLEKESIGEKDAGEEGEIAGYVYASPYHERAAFQWDVEISAYFSQKFQGMGLGTCLYETIFSILRELGYLRVYAVIALPNEKSVGFHASMGFQEICRYPETGFKLGQWHDILVMEKLLCPLPKEPLPPRAYDPGEFFGKNSK